MEFLFSFYLLIILLVVMAANGYQGLWHNLITFINVIIAALLATNLWEPIARGWEGMFPTFSYLVDFISLWGVFVLVLIALRLLTESPTDGHAEPSDLLISDIHLPGRSGLELLASLRDRQLSIPVIIISAFLTEEVRDDAERLGATSVLSKPFQLSELLSHVHRHLHG